MDMGFICGSGNLFCISNPEPKYLDGSSHTRNTISFMSFFQREIYEYLIASSFTLFIDFFRI